MQEEEERQDVKPEEGHKWTRDKGRPWEEVTQQDEEGKKGQSDGEVGEMMMNKRSTHVEGDNKEEEVEPVTEKMEYEEKEEGAKKETGRGVVLHQAPIR